MILRAGPPGTGSGVVGESAARLKYDGAAYDSTNDLQMRLLPFSHAVEYFDTRTE